MLFRAFCHLFCGILRFRRFLSSLGTLLSNSDHEPITLTECGKNKAANSFQKF